MAGQGGRLRHPGPRSVRHPTNGEPHQHHRTPHGDDAAAFGGSRNPSCAIASSLGMQPMFGILALLIAATGWYYLFYSKAAERLESIEEQQTNRRRGILRRINAIVMLLMALGIAVGTYRFTNEQDQKAFLITWTIVMLLLPISVILALIDLRLTIKLREQIRQRPKT